MNDNRVLVFGALIGAATGLAAAMMLQRRAQKSGREITLSAGEGIQLGVMVLGLLRAVAGLADKDDQR
jgi:gas vesicle protein